MLSSLSREDKYNGLKEILKKAKSECISAPTVEEPALNSSLSDTVLLNAKHRTKEGRIALSLSETRGN